MQNGAHLDQSAAQKIVSIQVQERVLQLRLCLPATAPAVSFLLRFPPSDSSKRHTAPRDGCRQHTDIYQPLAPAQCVLDNFTPCVCALRARRRMPLSLRQQASSECPLYGFRHWTRAFALAAAVLGMHQASTPAVPGRIRRHFSPDEEVKASVKRYLARGDATFQSLLPDGLLRLQSCFKSGGAGQPTESLCAEDRASKSKHRHHRGRAPASFPPSPCSGRAPMASRALIVTEFPSSSVGHGLDG